MNAIGPARLSQAESTELVHYDAMCRAISEAHAVDEVKDIRDKALAIEMYARLAKNVEAEAQACEIRLRAERRAGQLLREMEKLKGSPGNQHTGPLARHEGSKPLAELGISHDQSSRWQKLAGVPEDDFEASLAAPGKPSTTGIIAEHAEPSRSPVLPNALWLWGRLLDCERNGLLDDDPAELFENMLPHMQQTVRELAPRVIDWLEGLPK